MLDHEKTTTDAREDPVLGRRDIVVLVVGGSIIAILYLYFLCRDGLQESSIAPEPSRTRVMVVVGAIEVEPRQANGKRWDLGFTGYPDPQVTVTNRKTGQRRQTPTVEDTLKAVYNHHTVSAREGDHLIIRVEDIDFQLDDLIGEHHFQVTPEMLEKGELELSFGQVKRLTLRFEQPQ